MAVPTPPVASQDDRENRVKQLEDIADIAAASQLSATSHRLSSPTDSCDREHGFRSANSEEVGAPLPMVLLIDDDRVYRAELSRYVRSNGFDSLESESFAAALGFVQAYGGVCVIVPELTVGSRHLFDYIADIRRPPSSSVVVLSSRQEETEKIVALELGADDFIPKTADRREILARIRVAARRLFPRQLVPWQADSGSAHGTGEAAGSWRFLRARRELIDPDGRPVRLTTAEFSLLEAFVENPGRPLSRDHLATAVLGRHTHAGDRGIDNLAAKLRRKLGDSASLARMIKTARPVGYVFTGFSTAEADLAVADPRQDQHRNALNYLRATR